MTVGLLPVTGNLILAPTRILLVGYGQSNMDIFFQTSNGSPQPAMAGTNFYNQDPGMGPLGIVAVPPADGLRILQNTVTSITGLPTLSMVAAIGGSSLVGLTSGIDTNNTGYQGLINQVTANILPTDQLFFLWDQGETDSAGTPELPDYYAPTVAQLHANLAAAIGRTTATAPWITSSKGVVNCSGCVQLGIDNTFFNGFATPFRWNVLTNALKAIPSYDPHAYWFNQYDYTLGSDGLHYTATGTALGGARMARYITNLMGFTTGNPVFEIASASVIDATNTALNVTHSLGTDYTPTSSASGTNGFEISGDNGVNWGLVSTTRTSATQIKLTHSSLSTTNARLVRHLYGSIPPDVVYPVSGSFGLPPSKLTFDNSSLTIPLSPTTWPLRTTGSTTLPMPTWRDILVLPNGAGGAVQSGSGIQLGPASENFRKFLILSFGGADFSSGLTISSLTITPQDFLGNNVGTPITLMSPTLDASAGQSGILGITLNANNAGATTFSINITFSAGTGGTLIQAWTVPFADLNSTTHTGANGSTTASSTTGSTTLTASAGGFIIATAFNTAAQTASNSYSFSGTDAGSNSIPMLIRWLNPGGIATMSGDGANIQTSGTASVTAAFFVSGTVNIAAAAFR